MSEELVFLYHHFLQFPTVSTDSRNCAPNSIFFALRGENHNANAFAGDALSNGCAYAVVDEPSFALDERYVVVPNVLEFLQEMATHHRLQMGTKIIGITGSNGKTTTKELTASVLKEKYQVLFTPGNWNNHIGVPLTLLQLKPHHQLAIVEMGANHIQEIEVLSQIARPDFGLITNVGKAHLEGFGSFEGVKKAKSELYQYLFTKGMGIFVNIDNPHLMDMIQSLGITEEKIIPYSLEQSPCNEIVTAKITGSNPCLTMECCTGSTFEVRTKLVGNYNAENVLAAVTIGHFFGLKNSEIQQGIENYTPQNNRSQLTHTAKNQLVVDAYNANPTSMQVAIHHFKTMNAAQKMLILGEMKELGDESVQEHQSLLDSLKWMEPHQVLLVGLNFEQLNCEPFHSFSNVEKLIKWLEDNPIEHKTIFIKGSRAVQLEKIIHYL